MFRGLNPGRILGVATCAAWRVAWDVPIGAHQGIAHPLAITTIAPELARLMTMEAA